MPRKLLTLLASLMIAVLIFGAVGCGGGEATPAPTPTPKPAATQAAATATPKAELPNIKIVEAEAGPPGNPSTLAAEMFKKVAEQLSGGKITVEVHAGGALLKGTEISEGVKNGIADVGTQSLTYIPALFPLSNYLGNLSYMVTDTRFAEALRLLSLRNSEYVQEFEKQGLIVLWANATGPYYVYSRTPIKTTADMKGKRIRSGGAAWGESIKAMGGEPVFMDFASALESLERGAIDGIQVNLTAAGAYGILDRAKYVTNVPVGGSNTSAAVMSKKKWDALPAEAKTIVLKAAAAAQAEVDRGFSQLDKDVFDQLVSKWNAQFIEPDEGLKALWTKYVADSPARVATQAPKEMTDVAKFIKDYQDAINELNGLSKKVGNDWAAWSDTLWKQFYEPSAK